MIVGNKLKMTETSDKVTSNSLEPDLLFYQSVLIVFFIHGCTEGRGITDVFLMKMTVIPLFLCNNLYLDCPDLFINGSESGSSLCLIII